MSRRDKKANKATMDDIILGSSGKTFGYSGNGNSNAKAGNDLLFNNVNVDKYDIDAEQRKVYNAKLASNEFDKVYLEFDPLHYFLIRYYIRDVNFSKGGLVTGSRLSGYDFITVKTLGASGSTYVNNTISNPFQFKGQAVIVAAPGFEEKITCGTNIAVNIPQSMCPIPGNQDVIEYENWFVHPEGNMMLPTTDIKDDHFGYALIDRSQIKGIIK